MPWRNSSEQQNNNWDVEKESATNARFVIHNYYGQMRDKLKKKHKH